MKKTICKLIALLVVLSGSLFFFIAYRNYLRSHQEKSLILYGNVDVRQVDIGFRVMGKVQQMLFEEGDLVEAGKKMASLDTAPYVETVNRARAKVASLTASLKQAESNLQRREVVINQGAVSKENYDDAYFNVKKLQADLKEAEASLDSALIDLRDAEMFAPNKGTILTRIREPGAVVNTGQPIYTLSILSPVWVRAYISEPDLGKIYPGMKAEVFTDTNTLPIYKGQIGFISPVAEFTPKNVETTKLRTDLVYRIRVIVDNPDLNLKQGMPVTVKINQE